MSKLDAELERAAEAIWTAEFLLVVAGPNFDEGSRSPFSSDYCDSSLVSKPNKLMGFWGSFFNEYNDKTPHEGFQVLTRWRDRFFCQDDARKRQQKRRPDDDGEAEKIIAKCGVFTPLVSNLFQRCGMPGDEVYEPCGNVFQWQCSASPPCSTRITPIDRSFRFAIDDATQEAMPIKYVADRRDAAGGEATRVVNHDAMELEQLAGADAAGTDKPGRADRAQRVARAMAAATVHKIRKAGQVRVDRFPDGFTEADFVRSAQGTFPVPRTFDAAPPDDEVAHIVRASAEAPPAEGDECQPPVRASHTYAHFFGLDESTPVVAPGSFFPADPRRFQLDREARYYAATQQKVFVADAHTLAIKRSKYIRYNVSVGIVAAEDAVSDGGHPVSLVPPAVRKRVIAGEGMETPPQGVHYFSNVPSRQTLQEPVGNRHHDVVQINFPVDEEGNPTFPLPSSGMLSVVCETVAGPAPDSKPAPAKRDAKAEGPPAHPHNFTDHVWQLVGRLALVPDLGAVPKDSESKTKDIVEYFLESPQRYVVRVAVKRSMPDRVLYMQLEVPCEEIDGAVQRCSERPVPRVASPTSQNNAQRPPVPTQNHILCAGCHGVARPFVLMTRPGGSKDDGFCQGALAGRTKAFKAWEKAMTDALKQDSNKSIVILEAGCDKRVDVSRSYSEKTFKSLKSGKCTFVRIAPQPIEVKKGNAAPEPNAIFLEMGVVSALSQLDRIVGEKARKRG